MTALLILIIACLHCCWLKADNDWIIAADSISLAKEYYAASAANGELGVTVEREPFSLGHVIVGSSFEDAHDGNVAQILEGINPIGLELYKSGEKCDLSHILPSYQNVDMLHAVHVTKFSIGSADIVYSVRAMRNMPYMLMIEVETIAEEDVELTYINTHIPSRNFIGYKTTSRTLGCDGGKRMMINRSEGSYNNGTDHIVASSAFIPGQRCNIVSEDRVMMNLKRGEKGAFSLIGTLCTSDTFSDPWNESERQVMSGIIKGTDQMIQEHESLWRELWKGDITVEGDVQAQKEIRFALYNLYSSIRKGTGRSIAPMGLSVKSFYNGHIFWDAETWMFPVLLILHPDLALEMLNYRYDGLSAARKNAAAHGYSGAMYPWEGDHNGEESTPTFALTGIMEHHISADIAIACWRYWCVTKDYRWLEEKGYEMMSSIAKFWCDRVTRNADGSYSIKNIIGADEYAENVTDNAFTNASVKCALYYTLQAARIVGAVPDQKFKVIADGLRIPKFPDGTTREHSTYDGEMIKQADSNLLGFPLQFITDPKEMLQDLKYYEHKIDPKNGPAMSYSVFAVQYSRLGMRKEATAMFERAYKPNLRAPFGVFAETPTSGNPYFMTGAGAMLQSVIFGFGGVDITGKGIKQVKSVLPDSWTRVTIKCKDKVYTRK